MQQGSWTIRPCPYRESGAVAHALDVSETTASVLVRRGYGDSEKAEAFLRGELPGHDPFLLGDMAGACASLRAAIADGRRIVVHGDYDVDGICATALAVTVLRELGADVGWHLPSRFASSISSTAVIPQSTVRTSDAPSAARRETVSRDTP